MAGVTYVSALDRLREFAVVKSFGGSSSGLLWSVMLEALLVALIVAAVGAGVAQLLLPRLPLEVEIPDGAYVRLVVQAVVAGLVASIGAMRRAVSVDPALAFSSTAE